MTATILQFPARLTLRTVTNLAEGTHVRLLSDTHGYSLAGQGDVLMYRGLDHATGQHMFANLTRKRLCLLTGSELRFEVCR